MRWQINSINAFSLQQKHGIVHVQFYGIFIWVWLCNSIGILNCKWRKSNWSWRFFSPSFQITNSKRPWPANDTGSQFFCVMWFQMHTQKKKKRIDWTHQCLRFGTEPGVWSQIESSGIPFRIALLRGIWIVGRISDRCRLGNFEFESLSNRNRNFSNSIQNFSVEAKSWFSGPVAVIGCTHTHRVYVTARTRQINSTGAKLFQ